MPQFDELLTQIKKRYEQITKGSPQEESFLAHLRSLGHWNQEKVEDYPNAAAVFPKTVYVAYAVCQPNCGVRQFIIEGSTQECQHCGGSLFRLETKEYTLSSR